MAAKERGGRNLEPSRSSGAGQEAIRCRAYEIFLERGEHHGGELDDWLRAEREFNKALVLEAFDTLFNQRDYAKAEHYWSPNYIQHSAHIKPGREGLFDLIKSIPPTLKYEPGTILAEGDFVVVHGRYSGTGLPVNWIVADILRIDEGVLVEHWDVIQDEATENESKSRPPTFGDEFAKRRSTVKQQIARTFEGSHEMNMSNHSHNALLAPFRLGAVLRFTDTAETTCLHVPSLALIAAGDAAYNGVHPRLVESNQNQKRDEWLSALDKMESLKARTVVAGHKNRKNDDDGPRVIGQTRQYILDFQELATKTTTAKELYDQMLSRYPEWLNRGALWTSISALRGDQWKTSCEQIHA